MNCKPFGATANWNNTLPIFNCRYMFSHEFDIFAKISQKYSPYGMLSPSNCWMFLIFEFLEVIDNKVNSWGINNQNQPNFNSKSLSYVLRDPTHISGFNKFNDNFCNDSAAWRGYKNDVVSSRLLSYEHQPKQIQKSVTVKVNVIKRNYQVPQYSSQNMGWTTNSSPLNIPDFISNQSRSLPSPTPNLMETSCEKLESWNIQTQLMNALSPKEIVESKKSKYQD